MNKRQRTITVEVVTVIIVTAVAIAAMFNFKDWVNRSEAITAVEQLSQVVTKYRQEHGSIPAESYVTSIKKNLKGGVRLGDLRYRAEWIDLDAKPDTILAYTEKKYPSSLLGDGYVVLRLDGRVEWMGKEQFEKLLAQQQSKLEIDMMRR
jgi:type II secretory pathway pseudopilin PulG